MPSARKPVAVARHRPASFSARTFRFLAAAGRQKSPNWLDRNRSEYETALLKPLQALAAQLRAELSPLAPGYHFPQKGLGRMKRSAPRIEKAAGKPSGRGGVYKNWMTYQASKPRASRFEINPNLYFMIDMNDPVDTVLVAGGLYVPSSKQTRAIREAIASNAEPFERLFADREFKRHFPSGFSHDRKATRPPRGFNPDHPKIDWLKLQAFFVWKPYARKRFMGPGFARALASDWRQILRLNELLDQAIQGRYPKHASLNSDRSGKRNLSDRWAGVEAPRREMDF